MPKVTEILEQSSGTRQECISVFFLFCSLVKSHNMVVKSADHGNDVVVLLFCSFFFHSAHDFPKKFNENGRKTLICNIFPWSIEQIDFMLPWVCSAVEHGRRQNVVKTSVTHFVCGSCATYFVFSTDILMSSVIYYWTWRTATWNLFVKQTMGNCCIRLTSDNSNPRKLEPRANSNQSRFTLDFLLTFTVILPSVTRTLYNSNLSLTRTNFCFPSAHFYTVLSSITKTML